MNLEVMVVVGRVVAMVVVVEEMVVMGWGAWVVVVVMGAVVMVGVLEEVVRVVGVRVKEGRGLGGEEVVMVEGWVGMVEGTAFHLYCLG